MTREQAIQRLKYDRAMCYFNPTTGENDRPISEDCREMAEAIDEAIKALEQPTPEKILVIIDAEAWSYCDYLLRKYEGGSREAEGASHLASNIRERLREEFKMEDEA